MNLLLLIKFRLNDISTYIRRYKEDALYHGLLAWRLEGEFVLRVALLERSCASATAWRYFGVPHWAILLPYNERSGGGGGAFALLLSVDTQ